MQKELNQMKDKSFSQKSTTVRQMNQVQNTIQQVQQSNVGSKPMSEKEKTTLKESIEQLTEEQKRGIIEIVKDCIAANKEGVLEFELD
jgi:uncharacterized membrane-anchored protein